MSKLIGSDIPSCPPKDAESIDSAFYRFYDDVLDINVFKSHFDLGIVLQKTCESVAISVLPDLESVDRMRKMIKKFKTSKIAILEIKKSCGKVYKDKPYHANWWHPLDFDPLIITGEYKEERK